MPCQASGDGGLPETRYHTLHVQRQGAEVEEVEGAPEGRIKIMKESLQTVVSRVGDEGVSLPESY